MKSNLNRSRRTVLCAGVLALALLASCGGGGTTTNSFTPARVLAFGDETSVINDDGSKYTVNGLVVGSDTVFDCNANPIWIQSVAGLYGLAFPQCASTSVVVADPASRIYATNGALVADLTTQIDRRMADGGFSSRDLVTILVGVNDVIAQFQLYPDVGEPQLLATLDQAGRQLAAQANRLANTGARVLISTIPDVGLMPLSGDRTAGSTNGAPALLGRLSARFNDAMLANLTNDGHKIGLIQLDEYLSLTDRATQLGAGTFYNTTLAACAVATLQCTSNTLVPDAANGSYLWADDRHLGAGGQGTLAALASTRAVNNPF